MFPPDYKSKSIGEKYQFLTSEIIKKKKSYEITDSWEAPYFSSFLYECYPPPSKPYGKIIDAETERKSKEQQKQTNEFYTVLNELQRKKRISGEDYRHYSMLWSEEPQNREQLNEKIKQL